MNLLKLGVYSTFNLRRWFDEFSFSINMFEVSRYVYVTVSVEATLLIRSYLNIFFKQIIIVVVTLLWLDTYVEYVTDFLLKVFF